jgi:hypothetical protein
MIRAVLAAAAILGAASFACAQSTATTVAPIELTAKQRQLNIDSFEYVWTAIRDKHWQTKPAGLDWQAVHEELRPL